MANPIQPVKSAWGANIRQSVAGLCRTCRAGRCSAAAQRFGSTQGSPNIASPDGGSNQPPIGIDCHLANLHLTVKPVKIHSGEIQAMGQDFGHGGHLREQGRAFGSPIRVRAHVPHIDPGPVRAEEIEARAFEPRLGDLDDMHAPIVAEEFEIVRDAPLVQHQPLDQAGAPSGVVAPLAAAAVLGPKREFGADRGDIGRFRTAMDMGQAAPMVGFGDERGRQVQVGQFSSVAGGADQIDQKIRIASALQRVVPRFQLARQPGEDRPAIEHQTVQQLVVVARGREQRRQAAMADDVTGNQQRADHGGGKPQATEQGRQRPDSSKDRVQHPGAADRATTDRTTAGRILSHDSRGSRGAHEQRAPLPRRRIRRRFRMSHTKPGHRYRSALPSLPRFGSTHGAPNISSIPAGEYMTVARSE